MKTNSANCVLTITILVILPSLALAHYNLKDPLPYNNFHCSLHSLPKCLGPCPPISSSGYGKARNSPRTPSRVWRRMQNVSIQWHRNNHEGGFYRRSLVPVAHMFDPDWHSKTAFDYGCWSQGVYECGKEFDCGTDNKGYAYSNYIQVPRVFPDGDYVFAMVWYGGLHWQRQRAYFPDFYACSFVRIEGGPFHTRYTPKFQPGENKLRDNPPGKCATTSRFVGECDHGQACFDNPVENTVPGVFQHGKAPPKLHLKDLAKEIEGKDIEIPQAKPEPPRNAGTEIYNPDKEQDESKPTITPSPTRSASIPAAVTIPGTGKENLTSTSTPSPTQGVPTSPPMVIDDSAPVGSVLWKFLHNFDYHKGKREHPRPLPQ